MIIPFNSTVPIECQFHKAHYDEMCTELWPDYHQSGHNLYLFTMLNNVQ